MLRLDPAYPPLWRDATVLQFGLDATLIVDDPAPWQERLLHELGRGVPEIALEPVARMLGAPPAQARTFVRRIARALEPEAREALTPVTVRVPPSLPEPEAGALAGALTTFGGDVDVGAADALVYEPPRAGEVVVLVARHLVDPRHVTALMRDDVIHVPVVLTGRQVSVGPVVRPGETACLTCIDAHRQDADASWPTVAAQLLGRHGPGLGVSLAMEAGIAAGRLLSEPAPENGHSVTIHADSSRRTWQVHQPHPRCGCRSLPENATAASDAIPSPATTTATASVALA